MLTIKIKCPCETNDRACCACVSMHCDECHDHSKFKRGRFCSNCGRPLEAELQRNYIPRVEVEKLLPNIEKLKADFEQFGEKIRKCFDEDTADQKRLVQGIFEDIENILADNYLSYDFCYDEAVASEIATLKEKYTE